MGKITINFPNMPEGVLCDVPGYGVFANGTTTEIPQDEDIIVGVRDDQPPLPLSNDGESADIKKSKDKKAEGKEPKADDTKKDGE